MSTLKQLKNAARAPRAELNIEIAHAYWEPAEFQDRLRKEFTLSRELLSRQFPDLNKLRCSTSILIDDKRLAPNIDRVPWLETHIKELKDVFQYVDYIAFESELKNLLNLFYSRIIPQKRASIQRKIERYVRDRKRTACSHDIAIWHAMRSGALGAKNLPVYRVTGLSEPSRLLPSFCSRRVISILRKSDREHEDDAETDILRFVEHDKFNYRDIERYYYYG